MGHFTWTIKASPDLKCKCHDQLLHKSNPVAAGNSCLAFELCAAKTHLSALPRRNCSIGAVKETIPAVDTGSIMPRFFSMASIKIHPKIRERPLTTGGEN